jgi:gluconolactonase
MGIISHDRRFDALVPPGTEPVELYGACTFSEGPVWFADLQCLLFSDIPNSRIHRWTPDGHVGIFRDGSHHTNGNTRDRQGRLISCEHSSRRVTRTEVDGTITVLADRFEGRRLNSPNDVVVRTDGTIWFTDPDYGRPRDEEKEQAHDNVFRLDPATGALTCLVSDFQKPNGLCFSPDESLLYVADSAISNDPAGNSHIRRFRVDADGTISGGEVFVETDGIPDGLRVDTQGNVWTSAGAGVNVYAPDAAWLGRIEFAGTAVTNLCFGGPAHDTIFVTAGKSVWSVRVGARGAQWP